MRVLWLAPYPVASLAPEATFVRTQSSHPSSWIRVLSTELGKMTDIELHIATACAGIQKSQRLQKEGVTFHLMRHTFPCTTRGYPEYCRLDIWTRYRSLRHSLARVIQGVKPEILHVHGTEYGYGLAALESPIPSLISLQGIVSKIREVEDSAFYRLQARIEQEVIRRSKYMASRTEWGNMVVRCLNPSALIFDLPEAVHPIFFQEESRQETFRCLMVGGVQRRKGIEVALEAWAQISSRLPDATLSIVGSGDTRYLRKVKSMASALSLRSSLRWLGSKSPAEIRRLHSESALLLHPTLIDNSPNAIAEAMASGLPIVASRVGGIPSMIRDGESGVLVEPGDAHDLAQATVKLLLNPRVAADLARKAKACAISRNTPEGVSQKTMDVYKNILTLESGANES
jgi:glycosyltransferase involved in cell wall biosynthesis